jgi:hypothetical protein
LVHDQLDKEYRMEQVRMKNNHQRLVNWSYTFLVHFDSLMVTLLGAYLVVDMHLEVVVHLDLYVPLDLVVIEYQVMSFVNLNSKI